MNIRRSLKSLALGVLSGVFFLASNSVLAGGPEIPLPSPWMIYIGGFGGVTVGSFDYRGTYVESSVPTVQVVSDNFHQNGYLWGGQIGARYYFAHPWFFGLAFGAMGNTKTAETTVTVLSLITPATFFVLDNKFRINYNFDLTADIGFNVTPQTHLYLKGGGSYARFTQTLTVFDMATDFLSSSLQQITRFNRWGYVVGLGLGYDFTRCLTFFTEYNYYDYGRESLNNINNMAPPPLTGTDTYSQNVRIHAYSVRVGLNVNFAV